MTEATTMLTFSGLQNGTLVNTDAAPTVSAKSSLEMTGMDQRQLRELYLN